jgi:Xaa-Pro aminopeptidase
MDIAKRSERLRTALRAAQCDALLVTRRPNVQYLTGFTGSAGVIFFGPDELVLVTDGRYQTQANEQLEKAGVLGTIEITGPSKTQEQIVSDLASQYSKIGLESEALLGRNSKSGRSLLGRTNWFPLTR